jgi:hypothetical protein
MPRVGPGKWLAIVAGLAHEAAWFRGGPGAVAERDLAPELRVGTCEKIIPQLRLGLKQALWEIACLDANLLSEPPANPLRRRG